MGADGPAARAARALLDRRAGVPADLRDLGYVELTPAIVTWARRIFPQLIARWRAAGGSYSAGYDLGLDRLTRALPDLTFELLTEAEVLELWTRDGIYCYSCRRRTRWFLAYGYCLECGRAANGEPRAPALLERIEGDDEQEAEDA